MARTAKVVEYRARRSGEELEAAVYIAVCEELIDVGYSRFSFDGVAKRAGTGKSALYRRWRDKADLVVDALVDGLVTKPEVTPSGKLRDDLVEYFCLHFVDIPDGLAQEALRMVLAEARRFPKPLTALLERTWQPGLEGVRQILEGAAARGDIDEAKITPLVLEVVPGVLMTRYLLNAKTVFSRRDVEEIIDLLLLPALDARENRRRTKKRSE